MPRRYGLAGKAMGGVDGVRNTSPCRQEYGRYVTALRISRTLLVCHTAGSRHITHSGVAAYAGSGLCFA